MPDTRVLACSRRPRPGGPDVTSEDRPRGVYPPFGAYSHAVAVELGDSEIIFVTGQIALDDKGKLISDDTEVQARAVFEKIEHILQLQDSPWMMLRRHRSS